MCLLDDSLLKKTPLFEEHVRLGASMVPFGGWNMPVQYTNVIDEHLAARNNAGIFDICHMGEFMVSGEKAEQFLQRMVTNDIGKLNLMQSCYNCLCNEHGTVIDDLFVYKLAKNKFFLVVNAGTIKKDYEWLLRNNSEGVLIEDLSGRTAKLDVQGPFAEKAMQKLVDIDLKLLKRFYAEFAVIERVSGNVIISRTGYTGEDGFEIYFEPEYAPYLWNKILDAGKEFGMKPCGLGARDTLRLEACYSLYGHELNESITPLEAGLGFVVKLNKNFIGRDILEKQLKEGVKKKIVCFEMAEKAVPRENYGIFKDDEKIGSISSGTFSPYFKKGIGMGFVKPEFSEAGKDIGVEIRGKRYKAVTVPRPFYRYRGGK